jgi:hypothetical protein
MAKRRVRRLLEGRPAMDAVSFGTTYFGDISRGPEVAAVRCRLEEHLDMNLPGLRPDDRFADLHADLDPIFLDEIGREFGFSLPENYQDCSMLASSLPTVRHLVEFVVRQTHPDLKAEMPAGDGRV